MSDNALLPPERLEEIRARVNAATPGPWRRSEDSADACTIRASGQVISGVVATVRLRWVHADQRAEQDANAEFIANAPNDLADLLSHITALTEQAVASRLLPVLRCRTGLPDRMGNVADPFPPKPLLNTTIPSPPSDTPTGPLDLIGHPRAGNSDSRDEIELFLRDAYAAGANAAHRRSLVTAMEYAAREAPKLRTLLRPLDQLERGLWSRDKLMAQDLYEKNQELQRRMVKIREVACEARARDAAHPCNIIARLASTDGATPSPSEQAP